MNNIQMQIQDYNMKPYNLVVKNSLQELIDTVNAAIECGYKQEGPLLYMEQQYIQKIIINQNNQIDMSDFFKQLAEQLQDGQQLQLKISKSGDQISVFSTTKGASDFTAKGTPKEFDEEFIPALKKELESKAFSFTVVKSKKDSDSEDEEGGDDGDDEKESDDDKTKGDIKIGKKKEVVKKSVLKKETPAKNDGSKKAQLEKLLEGNKFEAAQKLIQEADAGGGLSKDKVNDLQVMLDAKLKESETVKESVKEEPKVSEPKKEVAKPVDESAKKANELKVCMLEGEKLMKERKYDEALKVYQQACVIDPDSKEAEVERKKAAQWVKMKADL